MEMEQKKGTPAWVWVLVGCGGCSLLIVPILAAILFPVFARAREAAQQSQCASRMKQIGTGIRMYAQDHNGQFPNSMNWSDSTRPYLKAPGVFDCPSAFNQGYAYSSDLSNVSETSIPNASQKVIVFETNNTVRNASGAWTGTPQGKRHRGGDNVVFVDGHVRWISPSGTP